MEGRVAMDCRKMPSESNCSLYISGRREEVVPVAVEHAIKVHRHERSPELERMISDSLEPEYSAGSTKTEWSPAETRPH